MAALVVGAGALAAGALAQSPARTDAVRPSAAPPGAAAPPAALPAHARFPAPWVGLAGAVDRAGGYDPTRLRVSGDTADVWLRHQFPRDVPLLGAGRPGVRALETRHRVRCAARQARDLGALVALGAAGDTLGTYAGGTAGEWERLGVGFRGHLLARVCACLHCARTAADARR